MKLFFYIIGFIAFIVTMPFAAFEVVDQGVHVGIVTFVCLSLSVCLSWHIAALLVLGRKW